MSQLPRVSLCMIVRDEAANLPNCLADVAGLVDETIVVDTGSRDQTREIAARFGARVFDFPWNDDFSAARNEAKRHASGRWIFWLDADDRISPESRDRLRVLFNQLPDTDPSELKAEAFLLRCCSRVASSGEQSISQPRLFPNRPDIWWWRWVHEQLIVADGAEELCLVPTGIPIRHAGYEDPARSARKQFRDLRLLEMDYVLDPDDLQTLYYLGRCRHWAGRDAEAIRLLSRILKLDTDGKFPGLSQTYGLLIDCLNRTGRRAEALQHSAAAVARFPKEAELLYQNACLLAAVGRMPDAESALRTLITMPQSAAALLGSVSGLRTILAPLMLARIHVAQSRLVEAEAEARSVTVVAPAHLEAWIIWGEINAMLRRLRQVEAAARHIETLPNGRVEASLLRALAFQNEGRLSEARQWADVAVAAAPANGRAQALLSEIAFQQGCDWDECIELHRRALSIDSSLAGVRERLNQLLANKSSRLVGAAAPAGFSAHPAAAPMPGVMHFPDARTAAPAAHAMSN